MKNHSLGFFLILALFLYANAGDSDECVYTIYVKTGSIIKGGTNAKISVQFEDANNQSVRVSNLKSWGAMGDCHDYFERGNVDAFTGLGPCIGTPICRLNLTSDGSGSHHGWYCDYVEIISTAAQKPCSQTIFYVDQWLAKDVAPHNLSVVLDGCHRAAPHRHALIVGSHSLSYA
ncbi:lipoxygenase y domain-containing protein 1-like [Trifolium pratense]|uniref:Lipoxygenase y domain-containing protein 1-like n=1 Tax=Trifolium pratense TaxID=57577 RepID=A0A2K3L0R7_TRIPR|nr:lipoxygenase y domain-containing protein 1-like [Trifolium pratense]